MINKGIHNTASSKAVPCDLRAKMREMKADLIASGVAEVAFSDWFEALDVCPRAIGPALSLLECYEADVEESDIAIDFGSREEYGTLLLPNGAEIILIKSYSDSNSLYMIEALYFDGEGLRIYTPFAGNWVNVVYNSFLGDEAWSLTLNRDLGRKIYGAAFDAGCANIRGGYLRAFGVQSFELDYEAIKEELIEALSDV